MAKEGQPGTESASAREDGKRARSSLQALIVDGQALLDRMPRPQANKRQLPKRQQGVVLERQPFVPHEVRIARLLGLPSEAGR